MKRVLKISAIYYTVLLGLWALAELVVFKRINLCIENKILCAFIDDVIIKNLVWTLPAVMLIHHFKDDVYISLKEMFSNKVNWLKYMPVFILFTLYSFIALILQNGKLKISDEFGIDKIIIFLFVGLTEEIVFRGWLLNLTFNEKKKWLSIGINALLFLAIHFPIWIQNGVFISNFTSVNFLCIIFLSVLFSYTFIKSKNILVPIALHMYWDLLMFMFF